MEVGCLAIQEINKNKKKEKDVNGKKIEIEVPVGFKFVQEGNTCYFQRIEEEENFLAWKIKCSKVSGYFVNNKSKICENKESLITDGRTLNDRNIFYTSEQAKGSRALAMLSQQLADVNQDWVPKWSSDEVKYCIVRNCTRYNFVLEIEEFKNRYHFLAFKTREDAEKFLKENLDELLDAGVFI